MKARIAIWIAWHLPRLVVYWCGLRMAAHATAGKYGDSVVPEVTVIEMLDRWDKRDG